MPNIKNVKKENNKLRLLDVRNCSTRRWSSMRCKRSPRSLVSKNFIGSFINLMKKSEISEILMRVEMCSRILERTKSIAVRLKRSINCANRMSHMKPISLPPIPVSTIDCVRKGNMSCNSEPRSKPNINCVKKFLYVLMYFQRNPTRLLMDITS